MADCGQHCSARRWDGNACTRKPHGDRVHVWGSLPCETGNKIRYVDQEMADMYPACGFGGVMTAAEIEAALAEMLT